MREYIRKQDEVRNWKFHHKEKTIAPSLSIEFYVDTNSNDVCGRLIETALDCDGHVLDATFKQELLKKECIRFSDRINDVRYVQPGGYIKWRISIVDGEEEYIKKDSFF